MTQSFDPVWNEKYSQGFIQHAPWDAVVTALFRHTDAQRPRHETKILEIACGTCSNLLFAARMGFNVTGLDACEKAVTMAQDSFARSGLAGQVDLGNFVNLPYEDQSFHMVIARCGISPPCFDVADLPLSCVLLVL